MRLRSLDGLRGWAAVTVVCCHALITSQVLLISELGQMPSHRWSAAWFVSLPPLNLAWAGQQAVLVFFVLSGLVVTLPFVDGSGSWLGYYPRRFVRLYVPVWAAVGLAVILAEIVHRHVVTGASLWLSVHVNPSWPGVQRDLTLYKGPDLLNGALWSLRWEVWFSALLPLFVLFARIARRASGIKVLLALGLIALGVKTHHISMIYLANFAAGAAIAGDLDGIRRLGERLRERRALTWALVAVALTLLDSYYLWNLAGHTKLNVTNGIVKNVGPAAGAVLLVVLAMLYSPVKAACESRVGKWLGKVSFSLYLVHEPIVVSIAILLGGNVPVLLTLAISLPVALFAGWAFQRLVEGPAHDLSRAVGRAASNLAVRRRDVNAVVEPSVEPSGVAGVT